MNNKYLEYLKSYDPNKVVSKKDVKIRKKIYPFLKFPLKMVNPYKLHIVRKINPPQNKPLIYTPTHGFKDDLLNTMILIDDHVYTLFGSIDQFYKTFDGVLAHIIGVVIVDRDDKKSRKTSIPKMKRAMSFGANALIFPEGAWNLTDAELVMQLYPGFYRLAKLTNSLVVPVATHIEGKNCYGIQDEAIDVSKYTEDEARKVLRDRLSTLKWELMERYSNYSNINRQILEKEKTLKEQWEEYKTKLKSEPKYYIEEKEKNYPFKDKNIISEDEVFSNLDNIEIKTNNAFVLKRIKNNKIL